MEGMLARGIGCWLLQDLLKADGAWLYPGSFADRYHQRAPACHVSSLLELLVEGAGGCLYTVTC